MRFRSKAGVSVEMESRTRFRVWTEAGVGTGVQTRVGLGFWLISIPSIKTKSRGQTHRNSVGILFMDPDGTQLRKTGMTIPALVPDWTGVSPGDVKNAKYDDHKKCRKKISLKINF